MVNVREYLWFEQEKGKLKVMHHQTLSINPETSL